MKLQSLLVRESGAEIWQGRLCDVLNGVAFVELWLLGDGKAERLFGEIDHATLAGVIEDGYFSAEVRGDAVKLTPPFRRNLSAEENRELDERLETELAGIDTK